MLAIGIALLVVGLGASNPGIWIPGAAFMVIGAAKRMRT